MDLTFEDPPPEEPLRVGWKSIAEQLRKTPNKWAKFDGVDTSLAYRIKRGDYAAFPSDEFEAEIRRAEHSRVVLYIRYVGKGSS